MPHYRTQLACSVPQITALNDSVANLTEREVHNTNVA